MANQQITSLPGIGDLLSRSWQIYKARIGVFLGIMILPALLLLLFSILLLIPSLRLNFPALIFVTPFIFLIFIIIQIWASISLLYAIKEREQKIGIRESFVKGWHKIISYFWISLLAGLIVLVGFLLFIVPGIIFAIWFSLATYVLVAEGLTGMKALSRSKQLVSGYWWPVFGRFLLIGIIAVAASMFIGFILGIIGFLINASWINDIAQRGFSFFLTPFFVTYAFLIYEDLKKLKEGVAI